MEKGNVQADWAIAQIPKAAQKDPAVLLPQTLKEILSRGGKISNAKDVLAVQAALSELGFSPGQLDGIFKKKNAVTSDTMEAIRCFQEIHGLKKDGQAGKHTIWKILTAISEKSKQDSLLKVSSSAAPDQSKIAPEAAVYAKTPSGTEPIATEAPEQEWFLARNIHGLRDASSMITYGLFHKQTLENIRGISKPLDDLHHGKDAETAILIPGFLCNQWVMRSLGDKLSTSMNVVYPDIQAVDHAHLSLNEMSDKIALYIQNLEREGKLKTDGRYTIIGHSLGGSIALLVSQKLRAKHVVQVSTPNEAPAVAKISWLDYIPALFDLRNISNTYKKITPREPLERLTVIIPAKDAFIGTDVQGIRGIPSNISIGKIDGVIAKGWHIDPMLTDSGIRTIANAVWADKAKK